MNLIKKTSNMKSNSVDILLNAITLLSRESSLDTPTEDNSGDLVRTIIDTFKKSDRSNQLIGGYSTIISDLCDLITDMINNPENYDVNLILQGLGIILKDKPGLIEAAKKSIDVNFDQGSLKRSIIRLRNKLNNYYKQHQITAKVSKAAYDLKTGKLDGKNTDEYVAGLMAELDALTYKTKTKDPGVIDEIDIHNQSELETVMDRAVAYKTGDALLKTGWTELNDMFQGGFRRGTMGMFTALQHNYKSGTAQSLVAQIPRYNVPVLTDPSKKPLILYISLEDDSSVFVEFIYTYLYVNEHGKKPDMTTLTSKEAGEYIQGKLSTKGYHVKLLRIDPGMWSFKDLFNKVLEYEANGYEIHMTMLDYLYKIPTTGCISGPAGSDVKDLFNRCRNFFATKNILLMTPHQMSGDAKILKRNGVPEQDLVKDVAGKGFTEASKGLDQIVDFEFYINKVTIKRKHHLTFGWGKDRRPGVVDEDKKYFMLPFPYQMPILETAKNKKTTEGTDEEDMQSVMDML